MSPREDRQLRQIIRAGLAQRVFGSVLTAQQHADTLEAMLSAGVLSFDRDRSNVHVQAGDLISLRIDVAATLGAELSLPTLAQALQIATITADILLEEAKALPAKQAHGYASLRPLGLQLLNLDSACQNICKEQTHHGGTRDAIISYAKAVSYETSALLAQELGAFPLHQSCATRMSAAITNHRAAAFGDGSKLTGSHVRPPMLREEAVPALLLTKTRERWNNVLELGQQYGFRHAKVLAITKSTKTNTASVTIPEELADKWQTKTPLSQEEIMALL